MSETDLELFEYRKGSATKLNIFSRDINTYTFKYFPNVKVLTNTSTIDKDELQTYIEACKEEFSKRSKHLEACMPIFSFLIKPDLIYPLILLFDLSIFEWMEIDNFEMEPIELISSECMENKIYEVMEKPERKL
ncbi:hypothetical protein TNCV_1452901 [Trichonephila clavipes]|nr:hypothetical protein TNCV_1452901 [Trichonephila clavipes]